MLYEYAKQIIAMFFLIAIVNLLVIPASYKKIITFYLHFFIIVIILKPVISIMNNEVTSLIDSVSFLDEGSSMSPFSIIKDWLKRTCLR